MREVIIMLLANLETVVPFTESNKTIPLYIGCVSWWRLQIQKPQNLPSIYFFIQLSSKSFHHPKKSPGVLPNVLLTNIRSGFIQAVLSICQLAFNSRCFYWTKNTDWSHVASGLSRLSASQGKGHGKIIYWQRNDRFRKRQQLRSKVKERWRMAFWQEP